MPPRPPADPEPELRPHVYDGIQEFDQRLPNWWLYTLYGTIVFAICYWFVYQISGVMGTDGEQLDGAIARIAAVKMASSIDVRNDDNFWEMSRNPVLVAAGKQTFDSLCVACHLPSLRGKSEIPTAVGPTSPTAPGCTAARRRKFSTPWPRVSSRKACPPGNPCSGRKKPRRLSPIFSVTISQGSPSPCRNRTRPEWSPSPMCSNHA